jgi:hypothetical protein
MSAGELECAQAGSRFPITGRGWVACRRQARGAGSWDPMPTVMVHCDRCRSANVPRPPTCDADTGSILDQHYANAGCLRRWAATGTQTTLGVFHSRPLTRRSCLYCNGNPEREGFEPSMGVSTHTAFPESVGDPTGPVRDRLLNTNGTFRPTATDWLRPAIGIGVGIGELAIAMPVRLAKGTRPLDPMSFGKSGSRPGAAQPSSTTPLCTKLRIELKGCPSVFR